MVSNKDVLKVLLEIVALLELQGVDSFRSRSYARAAETVRGLTEDLNAVWRRGELTSLSGIGESLAEKIAELLETGRMTYHQEQLDLVPPGLLQMIEVPELGPKTARKLHEELGLSTIDEVELAASEGRIAALKGFGAKSQQKLLDNIAQWRRGRERVLSAQALMVAEPLLAELRQVVGVEQVSLAGSLRRGRDTTKDLDILVAAEDPAPVMAAFIGHAAVEEVVGSGETKSSVRLAGGLGADLRVVDPASWGAALQYFTGSKAHNIAIRSRARERGLTINEYGVFPLDQPDGPAVAAATEQEVYAAVGLPWIPPELREDRGELAAAEADELPVLIELTDLRGDLHSHTDWSDGHRSIAEMAAAAAAVGHDYYAICDHTKSLAVANGLNEERLKQQMAAIAEVRAGLDRLTLLHGSEVDILADGRLDLDHAVLAELDLVVASVHSAFRQDPETMTRRLIAAIETGLVRILGHPTGRLLTRRDGFEFDFDKVVDAAVAHRCALEINAAPERLDLDEVMARRARRRGALLSINTDAHHPDQLGNLRFGVAQARRAWLTADNVINTWLTRDLLAWLKG